MISIGEARRRRRRRTFDGKRPDKPSARPVSGAATSPRTHFVESNSTPPADPLDLGLPSVGTGPALRRAKTEKGSELDDSGEEDGMKLRTKSMGE